MKTSEQKRVELLELVKQRQKDCIDGYLCLSKIHGGYYECDYVSPWSILAHDVDADLMIFGKDWSSSKTLCESPPDPKRREIGQDWNSRTNRNVRAYLRDHMGGLEFSQTYSTNVFPFIKIGKKNARISPADMLYGAHTYALPQIRIVSPRIAICLGSAAFRAMSRAAVAEGGREVLRPLPHVIFCGVEIYKVPHPSYPAAKTAVEGWWKQLGGRFKELRRRGKP